MISLNYRDARPIYEQVEDGLRRLIVTGAFQEGEKLPSVRSLAASLSINPTTIQKAYDALEKAGYLRSSPGRGCFAAIPKTEESDRQADLLQRFDETVAELKFLGVDTQQLMDRLKEGTK